MSGFIQPEQEAQPPQAPQVKPGLFFDDDMSNILEMKRSCNMIESYYVDINTHRYPIRKENYLNAMVERGNAFAIALNALYSSDEAEEPGPMFGLNDTEIDIINEWIDNSEHLPDRFVVFDWDNTLSLSKGFYGITGEQARAISIEQNLDIEYTFTPSDIISYLFGDDDRLNKIKAVISRLFDKGINVYIITRNPVAIQNKNHFVDVLRVLDLRFHDNLLIFAPKSKSAPLAVLGKCINPSGGKRKSKRNLKKRPKNRKTKNKRISYKRKS